MGTLSSWLWPAAQAACYHLLDALIHLQSALRSLTSLCSLAAARLAAAAPALRPVLAALFSLPPRDHIGSLPQRPITLGVAIAEEVADVDWPAAVEALGRLLAWCALPLPLPPRGAGCACSIACGCCLCSEIQRSKMPTVRRPPLPLRASAGRTAAASKPCCSMSRQAACSSPTGSDSWSCSCSCNASMAWCVCRRAGGRRSRRWSGSAAA